jgi:hypothetical protein
MALNQLIQAALTRLRKPPTVSLALAHARVIQDGSWKTLGLGNVQVGPRRRPESIARTHSPSFSPRS